MNFDFKYLSDVLVKRYTDRYDKLGHSIGTLGWGSKEQQEYRFSIASSILPCFKDKKILDIGCGFGDYFLYLEKNNFEIRSYLGIDINSNLIMEARKNIIRENVKFEVNNILIDKPNFDVESDCGFMFGILNFKFKEKMDNFEYSKFFIKKAFSLVRESLVFDFISLNVNPSYPIEDFIYYHNPVELFKFCLELTPNVSLVHDYKSIPQRECMMVLSKEERI